MDDGKKAPVVVRVACELEIEIGDIQIECTVDEARKRAISQTKNRITKLLSTDRDFKFRRVSDVKVTIG